MNSRWRSRLLFALIVLAPIAAGLFRVWVYQDAVQLGYRLSEGEQARRRVRNELHQLEVELAAERSPARLSEVARTLGLVPPESRPALVQGQAKRDAAAKEKATKRKASTEPAAPVLRVQEKDAKQVASGSSHGQP